MRDMSFKDFLIALGATDIKMEEIHMEDKQKICNLFLRALQETRNYSDLEDLQYEQDKERGIEVVNALFENGCVKTVNVACDSGIAMMQDIIRMI